KYVQARIGGNHPAQITGKMIAAKFQHDSARPDRNTGYAAPQLHTHTVIFNVTETEDGRIESIQPLELYRSQRYATENYRAVLSTELQKLGYEIDVDARTGAPEISGFSKEYLKESSPRREEVRKEAQEIKERLEREGAIVKEGAGLNHAAAHANRASKRYDHAHMRHRSLEMDARYGSQAALAVEQARKRVGFELSQDQIQKRAREAVTFARDNAMERDAVADIRKITADALRRNLGLTTYGAVMTDLRQRVERGEFIEVMRERGPRQATTRRMVEMEESNLQRILTKQSTT